MDPSNEYFKIHTHTETYTEVRELCDVVDDKTKYNKTENRQHIPYPPLTHPQITHTHTHTSVELNYKLTCAAQ